MILRNSLFLLSAINENGPPCIHSFGLASLHYMHHYNNNNRITCDKDKKHTLKSKCNVDVPEMIILNLIV